MSWLSELFNPKKPVDRSAEIARQQEQDRKTRIEQGRGEIDNAFSFFDPAYFDRYKQDFLGYYQPQVDQQFGDAKQTLRYDLARKGTLNSTPGHKRFADLVDAYGSRRDEVSSNALAATNKLQGDVETNKANLYQQNIASADPSLAAQSAAGSVGSLSTTPTYSPLADLFSGIVNTAGAYSAGRQNALPAGYQQYFQPGYFSGGGTSGRVVR